MDPLKTARLGTTTLQVTRLGIGGGALGGLYQDPGDDVAESTVRHAVRLGLNFFDTAPLYGYGKSELRLGSGLAAIPRCSFIVATKVGRLLIPEEPAFLLSRVSEFENAPPLRPVFDFSHDSVLSSIEGSLKRLRLDRIDVVYIHDPDEHYDQVIRETYPVLRRLREEGVIGAVGVAMNQAKMLTMFAQRCQFDCFLLAGRYTLLDQTGLRELLPLCVEKQISVVIGGPFNSGILATGAKAAAKFNYQDAPGQILERVERLERRCLQHAIPLKAAALQFTLAHHAVASTIPGCRSPEEVEENLQLIRLPIPEVFWADLKRDGLIPQDAPTPARE